MRDTTDTPASSVKSKSSQSPEEQQQQQQPRRVPKVELELSSVTYAPITSSAKSKGMSFGGGGAEKKRTTVLKNISTKISPYQLSGWMGPSGSGKSSLITVAADLTKSGDIQEGSVILVNGEEGRLPKRLVGVVWQDDLLLSNLTVEENIFFAARLKTPEEISDAQVRDTVQDVMKEVNLLHVRHNLVGSPTGPVRGISGGERKRVAVAAELVVRPSLLLLDEPTSGLDATTAQSLIATLQDLARNGGHAIAVVIHQPRTSIYNMFDHILLLSKGRVLYDGAPSRARSFLESCPSVTPLPQETGLADWMMDTIQQDELQSACKQLQAEDSASAKASASASTSSLAQHWMEWKKKYPSDGTDNQENGSPERLQIRRQLSSLKELHSVPKFNSGFYKQLKLLSQRTMKQQRGERITSATIAMQFAYLCFTALFWWRMPDNTGWTFERNSLLFFMLVAQGNGIVMNSVAVFQRERTLMSRERAKKMYGVGSFFLAKTASDMTNNVCLPVVYAMIVYWTANFHASWQAFLRFTLAIYLVFSTAQSMGLWMSIAIPNMAMALVLAPPITLFFMIMGGFYIPFENMHPGVEWASWLSFARYGYSALLINEYEGRFIPCAQEEVSVSIGAVDTCPLPGEEVIESVGIRGIAQNYWFNIGMMIALQVLFRVASYVLLRRYKQ